jgi:hypothetical protein
VNPPPPPASPDSPDAAFTLDPSAPLPAKLRNFYRFTYVQYATGTDGAPNYRNSADGCTVKRWVSRGRKSDPIDLPPLDTPAHMAAWFRRVFPRETVPVVLLEYETSAPAPAAVSTTPGPAASSQTSVSQNPDPSRITPISLDGLQMGEGEQVRQARVIAKANYNRVEEASGGGKSDEYRRWFPVWCESLELLRKLEKEDREARKAAGNLIDRSPVLAELAQLVEALRIMHEGMPARIIAEMEKAGDTRHRRVLRMLKPVLIESLKKVRASEASLFLNLESLNSTEDVKEKFAVAA